MYNYELHLIIYRIICILNLQNFIGSLEHQIKGGFPLHFGSYSNNHQSEVPLHAVDT